MALRMHETSSEERYLEDEARRDAIEDAARLQEMMTPDEVDAMEREIYAERAAVDAEAADQRSDEEARYAAERSVWRDGSCGDSVPF